MRAAARWITLLLAGLLLGAGSGSPGATLYINRVVVAAPGNIALDSVVRTPAAVPPEARELLARSVTILGDTVQYLPVSRYRSQLEVAFGTDAIIVGSWTLLVPRGTTAESQPYLLDRLIDFLISQGLVGDDSSEMTFTLGSQAGAPPRDGTPAFQVMKTLRGTEVSFQLTGTSGSSVSGRVTLAGPSPAADIGTSAVKGSSIVKVVFRKGPITVEMPGRVVSVGSGGQAVTVYMPDSQRTFTGRSLDAKVVQVDLP